MQAKREELPMILDQDVEMDEEVQYLGARVTKPGAQKQARKTLRDSRRKK